MALHLQGRTAKPRRARLPCRVGSFSLLLWQRDTPAGPTGWSGSARCIVTAPSGPPVASLGWCQPVRADAVCIHVGHGTLGPSGSTEALAGLILYGSDSPVADPCGAGCDMDLSLCRVAAWRVTLLGLAGPFASGFWAPATGHTKYQVLDAAGQQCRNPSMRPAGKREVAGDSTLAARGRLGAFTYIRYSKQNRTVCGRGRGSRAAARKGCHVWGSRAQRVVAEVDTKEQTLMWLFKSAIKPHVCGT